MIASSLYISRTNIFNNTAQLGEVIISCNSQVTLVRISLVITVDPVLPFCKLYEGNVGYFNITFPPETIMISEPPTHTYTYFKVLPTTALIGQTENERIIVLATSLSVPLTAILIFAVITMIVLILCMCKKGTLKNAIITDGLRIDSAHILSFHNDTSPICDPNSSEDEDDAI